MNKTGFCNGRHHFVNPFHVDPPRVFFCPGRRCCHLIGSDEYRTANLDAVISRQLIAVLAVCT